jgi:hypothetical protein
VKFWLGDGDDRLLAVFDRDRRADNPDRTHGLPSRHGIETVRAGEPIRVTGVIEALPRAEARYSWQLTSADYAMLAPRPVYLRVERAEAVEHAHGAY